MKLYEWFLLFLMYSILGWIVEVIDLYFYKKRFINRGFLIGPYCPIYGWGCVLITILLSRYKSDPVVLAIMSLVICAILEYFTSFFMEKIFKTRWWDYSDRKFNINGRISLETLIPFGLSGLLIMYVLNPFFTGIIKAIPTTLCLIISIVLFILFLTDSIVSIFAVAKIHISSSKLKEDSTEDVTKKVKEYIMKHSKLGKRIIESFPTIKIYKIKGKKSSK